MSRILGIDPGFGRMGWAIVDRCGGKLVAVKLGLIETFPGPICDRLVQIGREFEAIVDEFKPEFVVTERLIFAANRTTAFDVSKALGVVLYLSGKRGLGWQEYASSEIKQSICGNGNADKNQVGYMVSKIIGIDKVPGPDDVADALAIALTHAMRARLTSGGKELVPARAGKS